MEIVYKIYKHTFSNGDCYIGRSGEDDLHRRFKSGWGYQQDCPEFFSAIMECGWQTMEHTIIDETKELVDAMLREKYWTRYYQDQGVKVYNITNAREEEKYYYRVDGKEIYPTMRQVEKAIGASNGLLNNHYSYNQKNGKSCDVIKAKGHIIERITADEVNLEANIEPYAFTDKIAPPTARPVYCKELDKSFSSLTAAGRCIGVSSTAIYQAIKENRKCKGFTFVEIDKRKV